MRIVMTGSTGLIGTALVERLVSQGYHIIRLVRKLVGADEGSTASVVWDQERELPEGVLEGCDAVINLAGETIAQRWSKEAKEKILQSRVVGTRKLATAMAGMEKPPGVFLSASAVGFYNPNTDEVQREDAPAGEGFVADVCKQWEAATLPAVERGIRTVWMRTGVVLSSKGGALQKQLLPFKLGVGGVVGSGKQFLPWIGLLDIVRAMEFLLTAEGVSGPVNLTAPRPVTNREFTKALGNVLKRPTIMPIPKWLVKLLFGGMGESLLLGSLNVVPGKLQQAEFKFEFPELEAALRKELQ